ncbi:MAG: hypothetical protein AAFN92_15645 [Bacteroidota bacterium]
MFKTCLAFKAGAKLQPLILPCKLFEKILQNFFCSSFSLQFRSFADRKGTFTELVSASQRQKYFQLFFFGRKSFPRRRSLLIAPGIPEVKKQRFTDQFGGLHPMPLKGWMVGLFVKGGIQR